MQFKKSFFCLLVFLFPIFLFAQTTYLIPGTKDYILLDRLEIKTGAPGLTFSTIKPYSRKQMVKEVENIDSIIKAGNNQTINLSDVDKYNMERFLMNNAEWANPRSHFTSKKPILKHFYTNPGTLIEVNKPGFFLAINPMINLQLGKEQNNNETVFVNSRGVYLRGLIDRRVGFHLYFTENQERGPLYVQQFVNTKRAVPGAGFYKSFKNTGVDFFDIRGSVSWNVAKAIDMQFGYDRNFIGVGQRSLFLSDFSNNQLFLKINLRIWKLNYESLLVELMPDGQAAGGDQLLPRKYFRSNHLSFNATKWLNIGIFDAVMFGRKDHFDFMYLLPVMFLRPAEQMVGSPDNAVFGLDAKVNALKTVQLYGQVMFDEFKLSELRANNGWWGNKFGYQFGAKYVDAFKIKNLDLQVEANRIRPFTYSHFDSVASYTHYRQPLAHPLGANLQEFIATARYQPLKKLYFEAKAFYWKQGLDSFGVNTGSNPIRPYTTRPREYGFEVGGGNLAKGLNTTFVVSYEVFENLFFDISAQIRNYNTVQTGSANTKVISAGVRWNMARREYNF